jgi:NTE family protein
LIEELDTVNVAGGQWLMRQGDVVDSLYFLIRGRMERLTQQHLAGSIEDLAIPFFCVAARLDVGETCVHQSGPIWRALRATAALPGMLPPAVIEGRLLDDNPNVTS